MYRGSPVIDADSHKIENPAVFPDYVEPAFRARLRLVVDELGGPRLSVADRNPDTGVPDLLRLFPQPAGPGKGAFLSLDPVTAPGAVFNRLRVQDLDREGIDVQVLYGSLPLALGGLLDAELAVALSHACNDYLHDDCEVNRARLVPVGYVPLHDVLAAVEEMKRCVEQLGMTAVCVPPHLVIPHPDAPRAFPAVRAVKPLSHPDFDPLFAAAQNLDVPLVVHPASGVYLCGGGGDLCETYTLSHLLGHGDQARLTLAHLVMDGAFERFPRLRVGILDAGCGWIPDLAHALQVHWERRVRDFDPEAGLGPVSVMLEMFREKSGPRKVGLAQRARRSFKLRREAKRLHTRSDASSRDALCEHRGITRPPREAFDRGQIFATFRSGDPAPGYLRTALGPAGVRMAVWSVHYGQWDSAPRGALRQVTERPDIDPDYALRLLSANACALYGPRFRARIEPILRAHRPLLEGPSEPARR